jgi:hypothetical protein
LDIFGKKQIEALEATVSKMARENSAQIESLEASLSKMARESSAQIESLEASLSKMASENEELRAARDRFQPIVDAETESKRIISDANQKKDEAMHLKNSAELVYADMKRKAEERNKELLETISEQEKEIELNLQSLGVLDTRVMLIEDLDIDPKIALQETEENLLQIKEKVDSKVTPHYILVHREIEGHSYSYEPGVQRNMRRLAKMAFDGEIMHLQSKVSVGNVERTIEKARKKHAKINERIACAYIELTDRYLDSQLDKLRLRHSILDRNAAKKKADQAEREILRKERQLERENKQLIKDAEKAAKDETKAQEMLEKARAQLQSSHGVQMTAMQEQVERLESALQEAHARNERAKSMAQMTRAGHVYVISNQGSFGEGVYKIGLTRRLDPEDRVRELGDASVPFRFDTHALIWSEDAPALEGALHKIFAHRRVNLVNNRREFFRVSLDEIKGGLEKNGIEADIRTTVEAEEFRESKRLRSMIAGDSLSS